MEDLSISTIATVVAKNVSLETIRKNAKYNIKQLSVKAITIHNSGIILVNDKKYYQKCFFISIIDGFRSIGMKPFQYINTFGLNSDQVRNIFTVELVMISGMLNNSKIDTDNYHHTKLISDLVRNFNIKIEVYIGHYKENCWYTTPDPALNIGTGKKIIRILNKGDHFEYLAELESGFIEDLTGLTNSKINNSIEYQKKLIEDFEKLKLDSDLAKKLQKKLLCIGTKTCKRKQIIFFIIFHILKNKFENII